MNKLTKNKVYLVYITFGNNIFKVSNKCFNVCVHFHP